MPNTERVVPATGDEHFTKGRRRIATLWSSAALTGSYVTGTTVDISDLRDISIVIAVTTGATGATDEWLPNVQLEVSLYTAGNFWYYIPTETVDTGIVKMKSAEFKPNGGNMYTTADTTYRQIIATLTNQSFARIRASVKDEKTPTNAATASLVLTGRQ